MKCDKCIVLFETPIFFELLQEHFKMTPEKVIRIFHKKSHKVFND